MPESDFERAQEEAAAAEAARIGGDPGTEATAGDADEHDPANAPVREGGGGEAEGFEQAEAELVDRASHGDQHAARRVLEDAPDEVDDPRAAAGAEPDEEQKPDS